MKIIWEDKTCRAEDGHVLQVTLARPEQEAKAAVIILQEIFGITAHLREVAEQYAQAGYLAVLPHLYDRHQPGCVFDRSQFVQARDLAYDMDLDVVMEDLRAVMGGLGPTALFAVGYCWGGSVAYKACHHLPLTGGVSYYGTRTLGLLDETPRCPMLHHHGGKDFLVSMEDVEKIKAANPQGEFHIYPAAGHAFNNPASDGYDREAATLAWQRTLDFMERCRAS